MEQCLVPADRVCTDAIENCDDDKNADTDDINRDQDLAHTLENRIGEKRQHEYFEKSHPKFAVQNPRYSGICGSLGNPVFSDTPVQPPCYTKTPGKPCILPGYKKIVKQHPMYTTSNAIYGGTTPETANLPVKFFAKCLAFTKGLDVGGNYEDNHLTTETDKPFMGL